MSSDADVMAISYGLAQAVMDNGEIVPITQWIDCWEDECEPDDAVACVAGPTSDGKWLAIDLTMFSTLVKH